MTDINLGNKVQKLEGLLSTLPLGDLKFATSLVYSYKKYHNLTPAQAPWVDKLIARAEEPPLKQTVHVGNFAGVIALFEEAKKHLKTPKIALYCQGVTIKLALAGKNSKTPGSIVIVGEGSYPNRKWYGRVSPAGEWEPSAKIEVSFLEAMQELLINFSNNPAAVAKSYGVLTGNCCFCAKTLSDPHSVAAGFGPVCAEHYGLTLQWKTAVGETSDNVADYAPPCYLCGAAATTVADSFSVCASCKEVLST